MSFRKHAVMPNSTDILPGRTTPLRVPERHFVNGNRIVPPFPEGTKLALFGLGCFWGAERKFWQLPGVYSTSVGYAAGCTPNPRCSCSALRLCLAARCFSAVTKSSGRFSNHQLRHIALR